MASVSGSRQSTTPTAAAAAPPATSARTTHCTGAGLRIDLQALKKMVMPSRVLK